MKAFLCHSATDSQFVLQVANYLQRHFEVFAYEHAQSPRENYVATMNAALASTDIMIVFVNKTLGYWQTEEVNALLGLEGVEGRQRSWVNVAIGGQQSLAELPDGLAAMARMRPFLKDEYTRSEPPAVAACARNIIIMLRDVVDPSSGRPLRWNAADQLPHNPHLFDYEKRVIDFFIQKAQLDLTAPATDEATQRKISAVRRMLQDGCPDRWPTVRQWRGSKANCVPPELIGEFRPDDPNDPENDSQVVAAALTLLNAPKYGLSFREAGPRANLYYPYRPNQHLNVGIVVLGGIAPGINAVIDAIVQRHWLYWQYQPEHSLRIHGFMNGWWAFEDNIMERVRVLRPNSNAMFPLPDGSAHIETSEHATEGGSMLGTGRDESLTDLETRQHRLTRVANQLHFYNIDILYVIGGDGSMKAAHALWNVAQSVAREGGFHPLSVVAIPKTMDNDILWMWQSFGFISAVQKAKEVVEQLQTEVRSNPRLCVLQLFGSDSGFVVSHAVLASATGHCDLALIPEQPFSMLEIARHLKSRMRLAKRSIPHGLIVMAETAVATDALECLGERTPSSQAGVYRDVATALRAELTEFEKDEIRRYDELRGKDKRIQGQTTDLLRQASLQLMLKALPMFLQHADVGTKEEHASVDWKRLRVMSNEPRHLLRATVPSTSDITMAQRLGILAVDNALAGYTDFMISQWLTEYVLVPLELVVLGRKRIPQDGIFWKSVLAKTGQLRVR